MHTAALPENVFKNKSTKVPKKKYLKIKNKQEKCARAGEQFI